MNANHLTSPLITDVLSSRVNWNVERIKGMPPSPVPIILPPRNTMNGSERQQAISLLFCLLVVYPVVGRRIRPRQFDQVGGDGFGLDMAAMPPRLPPNLQGISSSYQDQDHEGSGTYRFGYRVDDPYTANHQSRTEEKDLAGRVTGSYSVLEPDGNLRTVYYVADKNGYRAFVRNSHKPSVSFGMPPYPPY